MEGWEFIRIRGIPLKVHPSWFLILTLFTFSARAQLIGSADFPIPILVGWILGLLTALLLFLSVLLHELGHSFVALSEGVKVHSITLFLLGGVARVEKECSTPMGTLRVAAAGPIVSFIIAFLSFQIAQLNIYGPLVANLFSQISSLNLVLALFNLLPGLPLDGGVILKSLVWQLTGSRTKGIKIANATGRTLSLLAIFFGVWLLLKGVGFGAFWLVLIGWFGLAASRSQSQILRLQKALLELTAAKAKSRNFRILEKSSSLRKLSELCVKLDDENFKKTWVLVCDSGRWIGYVNDQPLKDLPVQNWDKYSVGEFVCPLSELPGIKESDPLWKAVYNLEKSSESRLLVFNLAGLPSGTLDRTDIGQAVLQFIGINLPKSFSESTRNLNAYPLGIALPKVVEEMIASSVLDEGFESDPKI